MSLEDFEEKAISAEDILDQNRLSLGFINSFIETQKKAAVFLKSSVRLEGYILEQDLNSLTLGAGNHVQLVFKDAVSTINPLYKECEKR